MFYYIYQITNLVNNKIYVGVHKTKTLDDGYMGSGKVIKAAIQKYGPENFKKDILEFFENAELMYAKEKELVTEEFLAREDVYNLRRGGTGGFDFINKNGFNVWDGNGFHPTQVSYRFTTGCEKAKKAGKKSVELKLGIHGLPPEVADEYRRAGGRIGREKALDVKSKQKRKNTYNEIGHQQGNKNSQFGTCWMWHELIGSKKCKIELLPEFIEQGWFKGRNVMPL